MRRRGLRSAYPNPDPNPKPNPNPNPNPNPTPKVTSYIRVVDYIVLSTLHQLLMSALP